ncbi:glycosyltransferase family 2 protein [Aliterella atlantica]|uniref:glycosyltransferase family 2 protein n=1 Tax=Aliterella atlantica TaxID=1827278 RepID=UPI0006986442|nr:glycosyltransferase family 2 protein [Aliterella atlantica]
MNNTSDKLQQLSITPSNRPVSPWLDKESCTSIQKNDEFKYPKISVVTPSYNQDQFIEATISSVLMQNYPNLEYIIIDGGSTDKSVEIIRKYEQYLTYWVSEKDRGQSHAINKGFAKSTGDILCWINSDDLLKPGTLDFVARSFSDTSIPAWLIGCSEIINSTGSVIKLKTPKNLSLKSMLLWHKNWFSQQSTFWTQPMWEIAGDLDETLYYAMDFSLWINMFRCSSPIIVEDILSCYRFQDRAKCLVQPDKAFAEILVVLSKKLKPTLKDVKFKTFVIEALIKVAAAYSLQQLKGNKVAKVGRKIVRKIVST